MNESHVALSNLTLIKNSRLAEWVGAIDLNQQHYTISIVRKVHGCTYASK